MGTYLLKLPKMGESVAEATITSWLKEVGDTIAVDEAVVEIATDKVDSDVPSEVAGVLVEKKFEVDGVAKVGEVLAVIQTQGDTSETPDETAVKTLEEPQPTPVIETPKETPVVNQLENELEIIQERYTATHEPIENSSTRFYSPLVKNIAQKEGIGQQELDAINGTGKAGRVTKHDILLYLENRTSKPQSKATAAPAGIEPKSTEPVATYTPPKSIPQGQDQIIEMSRMGKLIADHMIKSKATSAHVQSFVEADVTAIWDWREKVKNKFFERTQEKLTFTPLFMMAVIKALRDFPMLNSAIDGTRIIQKGAINLGMATSLADGNLIVPVIKNADHLNLIGLTKAVNDLALRARTNTLKPDEIQGGTYTVTNVGNFGSVMGTPIINQPQVGILAIGVIRKMPAVIETPQGDFIGIRKKLILSHSYDHRIINGAMGGQFVKNVAQYLENWNEPLPF